MPVGPSDIIQWGQYAKDLKDRVDEVRCKPESDLHYSHKLEHHSMESPMQNYIGLSPISEMK